MKLLKLSALTLAITLTACGGGGGGSTPAPQVVQVNNPPQANNSQTGNMETANGNTQAKPAQPEAKPAQPEAKPAQPEVKPAQPEAKPAQPEAKPAQPEVKPITDPFIKDSDKEQLRRLKYGEIREDIRDFTVVGYNNQYSFNGAVLKVDNQSLPLSPLTDVIIAGLSGENIIKAVKASMNYITSQGKEHGVVYFGDETPKSVVDNLKGTATYNGVASRFDNASGTVRNIGTSTLRADFDNKTIQGKLFIGKGLIESIAKRDISLKETAINGNEFKGTAVAEASLTAWISREGKYEGKFFGPNAEEVAGKAEFGDKKGFFGGNLKDLDTSFSAIKK